MKFYKKINKDILIILALIVIFTPIILTRPLISLDEIWNYNFASTMAEGLVPYKDTNMLITPLLSFICAIFLKISNELIVMRILSIVLATAIMFLIYKVLTKLEINKYIALRSIRWNNIFNKRLYGNRL